MCVTQGAWQAARCYHGNCTADGACVCQSGYRDDNFWFGGAARCLVRTSVVHALLTVNLIVNVWMLMQLVRARQKVRREPLSLRNVHLGLVSTAAMLVYLTLNAAEGVFHAASQIPFVIAITTAAHADINTLSVLLSAVAACSAGDCAASDLVRSERERQRAVLGLYVITAPTIATLAIASLVHDDAQAARTGSSAWCVFVAYSIGIMISMCIVANRLPRAKASLVELISQFGGSASIADEARLRALKNRTTVTFWTIALVIGVYAVVDTAIVGVQLLLGFMPFVSILIHLATLLVPGTLIHVSIQSHKSVRLWSSSSTASFARKLVPLPASFSARSVLVTSHA